MDLFIHYFSRNPLSSGVCVRNVEHFTIRSYSYVTDDGNGVDYSDICDDSFYAMKDFCDLTTRIFKGEPHTVDLANFSEWYGCLARFSSLEDAQRVLNDICAAIAAGKNYFDLTPYNKAEPDIY